MADSKSVVLSLALGSALAWALAILLAPVAVALAPPVAGLVYALGSVVCHQLPERSFHLVGAQLPVCARCTGLYLGAAIGVAGWAAVAARHSAPWVSGRVVVALGLAAVPTAATVALALLGIADPGNPWRAAFAVPLGVTAGAVVGAVASNHLK